MKVLGTGRYEILLDRDKSWMLPRRPKVEIGLVDMRERDLTIKGQDLLTSNKVAIRVSIVQFRVTDPKGGAPGRELRGSPA